jgi:hypothetical protein
VTLASVNDYVLRFGTPTDETQIAALLNDASSLIRQITRQRIERVADDVALLDVPPCTSVLFLPELPVTAVSLVKDDGVTLTVDTQYWLWKSRLIRRDGYWTIGPRKVEVTYTHGQDPVEPWLTSLVCTMAHRATQSWVTDGVRSESFVDAYSVSYSAPATGGTLVWVTETESQPLLSLRTPLVA